MPKTVSDAQLIESWRRHYSPTLVAQEVGINARNVQARKKIIEARYGIRLPVIDPRRPKYDQSSLLISHDRAEAQMEIIDGTVIVSGDQHFWPGSVPVMHRAYVYLAKKLKPTLCVWNGDAFDGASISRFPSIGWESKPSVRQELDCVHERSHEVRKACPGAKFVWNLGNHDLRFETRLAAVAHEYRDVQGIHLKDHFPEWIPAWFVTINAGLPSHTEIRHREKGGIHAGYNNTKDTGVTMVTGHDHRAEVVAYDDRRGRRYGVRHGMGADSARDPQFLNYLEARKPNWQSAVAVLNYRNGQLLMPELAMRWGDNSFEFRGEIIEV